MKRKQKMKESSECIVRKGDNKETKKCRWKKSRSIHGDSEGGKKAGREADGGREAWKSDTGRKRAKDGHSLTVREGWGEKGMGGWMSGTQMGERKVGNNKSDGWK